MAARGIDDDFEDRLRAALAGGAAAARPDAGAFARTQRRHRRHQLVRRASVGTAVAGVLALALLAGPGLLAAPDVAFPPAEQPAPPPPPGPAPPAGPGAPPVAPAPQPAAAPDPGGAPAGALVLVDGSGRTMLVEPSAADPSGFAPAVELGRLSCASGATPCGKGVTHITVREGSTPDAMTLATRQVLPDRCVADIGFRAGTVRDGAFVGSVDVLGLLGCPGGAPLWSPDGASVAWADGPAIVVARWDEAAGTARDAVTTRVEGLADLRDVRLEDWVFRSGGRSIVVARGLDADGVVRMRAVEMSDTGDGHVLGGVRPLADGAPALLAATGMRVHDGQHGGSAAELRGTRRDDGWEVALSALLLDGQNGSVPLPAAVVDERDPDAARVWVDARGASVLVGDGVDDAWLVDLSPGSTTEPVPLPFTVTTGALLEADVAGPADLPPP